jgi:hypothetical protein
MNGVYRIARPTAGIAPIWPLSNLRNSGIAKQDRGDKGKKNDRRPGELSLHSIPLAFCHSHAKK